MFKVNIQPERDVLKSLHNVSQPSMNTVSTVTSSTTSSIITSTKNLVPCTSEIITNDSTSLKIMLPKIQNTQITNVAMEKGVKSSGPKTVLLASRNSANLLSPLIMLPGHSSDKLQHIVLKEEIFNEKPYTSDEKPKICKNADDKSLEHCNEIDLNDASIRRSKRKRIAKIKSDEPYKRPKIGEDDDEKVDQHDKTCKQKNLVSTQRSFNVVSTSCDVETTLKPVQVLIGKTSKKKILNNDNDIKHEPKTDKIDSPQLETIEHNKQNEQTKSSNKSTSNKTNKDKEDLNSTETDTANLPVIKTTSLLSPETKRSDVEISDVFTCRDGLNVISPLKSDLQKLGPTIPCFKCGSIFETRYAIIFTQRFYCCRECLPSETTREMRLGSIIKQCNLDINSRERKSRGLRKNYALMESNPGVTCTTPHCNGMGHINGKNLRHKGVSTCPNAQKNINKLKLATNGTIKRSNENSNSSTPVTSPHIASPPPKELKFFALTEKLTEAVKTEKPVCKPRESKKNERWKCPLKDCDGKGHTNGKYPTHRSLFGCPTARMLTKKFAGKNKCPNPECDSSGSTVSDHVSHDSLATCPLLVVDHERSCPVPGCDGKGHRKKSGRHTTHRSVSTCPRAPQLNIKLEDGEITEQTKCDDPQEKVMTSKTTIDRKIKSAKPKQSEPIKYPSSITEKHEEELTKDELLTRHNEIHMEVTLLSSSNETIKADIPKVKQQLRGLEKEAMYANERIEELLVEEYQTKNILREQRTKIENAIKLASIPVNFSDIPSSDNELFFERLKNYFNDRHTSIYREKLKTFLSKVKK